MTTPKEVKAERVPVITIKLHDAKLLADMFDRAKRDISEAEKSLDVIRSMLSSYLSVGEDF